MTTPTGILFADPQVKPISVNGLFQSQCYLVFYLTTTTTPTPVYSNGTLTVSLGNTVTADAAGRFVPIYMDPNIIYRVQLYDKNNVLLEDTDPYVVPGVVSNTQAALGGILWPRSDAEIAATITPTTTAYNVLNPFRYGADGTNGAADAAAYVKVNSVIGQISSGIDTWLNGAAYPGYPKTTPEILAGVTPTNQSVLPDTMGRMSVFRFFTEAQMNDVLAGTMLIDVTAAVQQANDYLEGRAGGSIATLGAITPGSGYTNGTYNDVNFSGGTGTNGAAYVTVAGGVVTSCTIAQIGRGYTIGDVLTVPAASIGGTGSGFSIPVTALVTTKGKTVNQGGRLFFPGGSYYFGTSTPRLGGNVRWEGSQSTAASLNWSNSYTGNGIQFGPDMSGFYGFSGYYTMQSSIENFLINCGTNQMWGIYCTGAQQGCYMEHLIVNNCNNGGIFYQDTKGAAFMRFRDIEIIGGANVSSTNPNCVGLSVNGAAVCQIDQISVNGINTTTGRFYQGIAISGTGSVDIKNYDSELNVTGLDITGTGSLGVVVDSMSINSNNSKGIWIHAAYPGSVMLRGIYGGSGVRILQNDVTGEIITAQGAGSVIPQYSFSGTSTDYGILQNYLLVPILAQTGIPATLTLDVQARSSYDLNVANNSAFTIAAPLLGSAAMPATGRIGQRLTLKVKNNSGGAMGVITWDAVFKKSAFTNPGNGNSRSIEFEWNGTNWVQLFASTVDVPT